MFLFHLQYGAVNACNLLQLSSEIHFVLVLFKHLLCWWLLCNAFQLLFFCFKFCNRIFSPWPLTWPHLLIDRAWTMSCRKLCGWFCNKEKLRYIWRQFLPLMCPKISEIYFFYHFFLEADKQLIVILFRERAPRLSPIQGVQRALLYVVQWGRVNLTTHLLLVFTLEWVEVYL